MSDRVQRVQRDATVEYRVVVGSRENLIIPCNSLTDASSTADALGPRVLSRIESRTVVVESTEWGVAR